MTHPVTEYAERVLAGDILAGELVQLACQRHLRDLERDDIYFDEDAADRIFRFFTLLPHVKGEWALNTREHPRQTIELSLWQKFVLGSVFGWKRTEDGLRRFRKVYEEVARKNAKSTKMSGVGNYMAFFDEEPGAEVYSAATTKDQAKIVWNDAKRMAQLNTFLGKRIKIRDSTNQLYSDETYSWYKPLAAKDDNLDGLNVHCAIVDELHAHPKAELYDVLDTALGSRAQPILWAITTAGNDRESVCWRERTYAINVLRGVFEDDATFAIIYTLDEGDDPLDPAVWPKANPNIEGASAEYPSVKRGYIEAQARKARNSPSFYNTFLRLHCNVWTTATQRWLHPDSWAKLMQPYPLSELRDRKCYAGLDIGRVRDLSAFVLVFPPNVDDPYYRVLVYVWCPTDDVVTRAREDGVPYDVWAREGWLQRTRLPNVTDFRGISHDILELATLFDIREIAYDRVFAGEVINDLEAEGLTMVPHGQGYVSMAAPVDETERIIVSEQLRHDGNPVMSWAVSNAVTREDPAGNRKLDKEASTEKIDPVVALVMAVGRCSANAGADESVYNEEERGLVSV